VGGDLGYGNLLQHALAEGWPREDRAISRWLDRLFEGEWVQQAEKASRLPLGLVQDPRLFRPVSEVPGHCRQLADILVARAVQLQARGDFRGALSQLETTLALSRQTRHDAPAAVFWSGQAMEGTALVGFRDWLQHVGPNKELLRTALALLQQHEAAIPDPVDNVKAQYVVERENGPVPRWGDSPFESLLQTASLVPWEKERHLRVFHALFVGSLQAVQEPTWEYLPWLDSYPRSDFSSLVAVQAGLPPRSGPGSQLSAHRWGELIRQQVGMNDQTAVFPQQIAWHQRWLRAARLATAFALYQVDHGRPPAQLDELVPAYLTSMPLDPYSGQPFHYRISRGEELGDPTRGQTLTLAPGQALIWSNTRSANQQTQPSFVFPVPIWTK
jgi:hypothetical protein